MLFEGVPYAQYAAWMKKRGKRVRTEPLINFIERKLGVTVLYPTNDPLLGKIELAEVREIAELLKRTGIIKSLEYIEHLPDEPSIRLWECAYNLPGRHVSGGLSTNRDDEALYAALAEALERYLWSTQTDYFRAPQRATTAEISRAGRHIPPERFVGFSNEQRTRDQALALTADASYRWIRGTSLIDDRDVFLPAQTVSKTRDPLKGLEREPLIREQSTIGLATWPTKSGARHAAALELIEHDAYMILWLNQLTLPRVRMEQLRAKNSSLDTLMKSCERYLLNVHVVRMLTDAPAHAVCAIVEDKSERAPRFAVGLSANGSLARASEKAILEALRSRASYRRSSNEKKEASEAVPLETIDHRGRRFYWGKPEHASGLEFLIRGAEEDVSYAAWENDSREEHLNRIIEWCRTNNYECAAVSLGTSKKNPTAWHVERVVMPDLQTTHLNESRRHFDGKRLKDIPRLFGFTPAIKPFIQAPHPFV
jgi:thiazole/oxazole-forming peptide maturase SagD family component